ncbi:MAG: AbrB/MazE/SpoVT family DNA-binding domain-containing protein [Candidatus Bathycorpusculaceae bacterium]
MTLAKVGKRGTVVIPSKEREKAEIGEGDYVEITAKETGLILMRKAPSLKEIQTKMAGKLPQWDELEGKADELLERET